MGAKVTRKWFWDIASSFGIHWQPDSYTFLNAKLTAADVQESVLSSSVTGGWWTPYHEAQFQELKYDLKVSIR